MGQKCQYLKSGPTLQAIEEIRMDKLHAGVVSHCKIKLYDNPWVLKPHKFVVVVVLFLI